MSAPDTIHRLVERFAANRTAYLSGLYKEARLRSEFLDPFFESLAGMSTTRRTSPEDAGEVIIEENSLKMRSASGAPDYAFRVEGRRNVYAEAKKPSANIEKGSGYASQLRGYSWNASLPLALLTDFEEFAVYDTRSVPSHGQTRPPPGGSSCSLSPITWTNGTRSPGSFRARRSLTAPLTSSPKA